MRFKNRDPSIVCVIGAGTMGAGIAQWFIQKGHVVELFDHDQEKVKNAQAQLKSSWQKLEQKGKYLESDVLTFNRSLIPKASLESFTKSAPLVIEAVVEDLKIKQDLFAKLDKHFDEEAILGTNTSSISITAIGKVLSDSRKIRFMGLHFFNPAPIMPLVEVITAPYTDAIMANALYRFFEANEKKPAMCKDSPGFMANRLARNFYGEAMQIIESNNPEIVKELDNIVREVGGFRMGPFELMDLIGIDVNLGVTEYVYKELKNLERFAPHPIQKSLVQEGHFGRKSGKGFYEYK